MKLASRIALSIVAGALSTVSTSAQISFNFNYTSGAELFTTEARTSLESAASIASAFFTHTASIDIDVTAVSNGSDTLASAGSNFFGPFANGFGNRGVVGTKIVTNGTDLNGGTADGTVNVNFGQPWDFDDSIAAGKYDFKSTMIHELLHAVGFSSDIQQNGNDGFGNTPGNPALWVPFNEFVSDSNGFLINSQFELNGTAWNSASVGGTGASPAANGLYFNGTNAANAFGGPVPLYSPGPWEDGSSGSHLDDSYFNGTTAPLMLMNAATDTGQGIRTLSNVEIGIFRDLGFTVVPEPYEYAILSTLGLIGFVYGRRRHLMSLSYE